VSIQDHVGQLRAIQLPFGALQQARQELEAAAEQASQILGEGSSGVNAIRAATQEALVQLDDAYNAMHEIETQIEQAANHHSAG